MLARLVAPLLATACLAATAQAARVALRIDPSLDADGRLATAIARAAGIDDWTRDVLSDEPATRPADAAIVACVTRVTIGSRPGVRIVVIDAARGLRLDVDATALLADPAQPTDAAGVADILGASARRAIEKARQPVERLFIVPPAGLPSLGGPPPAERPVEILPVEDAVVGAILARRGTFVREVEHRLALRPVPAMTDAPECPAAPTSLVAITLERLASTDPSEPLPGTLWVRVESPDGAAHEQSTPVARASELVAFTAALARAALADSDSPATQPATQPTAERLSGLVTYRNAEPRPAVVAALLELPVADAPGDVERRRALVAAYVEATRGPNGMTPAMTPAVAEREDVERWPVVRDFDRRAALRRRALAHAWQAMAGLPRITTRAAGGDRRDPLVAILAPLAAPQPYVSNVYEAIQRRLAESDAADAELFARWADERRRTGHFDEAIFVVNQISRLPFDRQADAAFDYLQANADAPGLIERAIDVTTPFGSGPRDNPRIPVPVDGMLRALTGTVGSARVRQASYAATMRRGETWTEEDRQRLIFGGMPANTIPNRQRPAPLPTGWKVVDDVPWAPAIGDDDGGIAFYATRLVVRRRDGAERTVLDVRGPAGEAGHVFSAAFDGRYGYASVFRPWMPDGAPTIYAFDPRSGAGRFLGEADGVPPCDADRVAFAPLGPGRLFVAGGTTSAWIGTIAFDGEKATTDVITRTRPLRVRPRPVVVRSTTRPATRTTTRPTTTTAPTTAEAMDATIGFVPTAAWPVGGPTPTHVVVERGVAETRGLPLLVSLADRTATGIDAQMGPLYAPFRFDGALYRFRPFTPTTRPATRPAVTRPTASTTGPTTRDAPAWTVERFDPETAQFVPAGRAIGFRLRVPSPAVSVAGGRIYVADGFAIYAAPSPTGPYEALATAPSISRYPLSGAPWMRVIRADPLTVWTGTATYRLDPTTRPAGGEARP